MEFEYVEFRWGEYVGDRARRLSSWLVENGYQSLQEEWRETAQRYLPLPVSPAPGAPQEARTADVLIPPADPASRILVCERPGDGHTVAVLAVGRTAKDARRHHTAVKLVLDAKAPLDEAWRGHRLEENGRDHARRFQEEWLPRLGLVPEEWSGPPGSGIARPLAAAEALFAVQGAPAVLGRPALFRSRAARTSVDPGLLDGLAGEGLVEKAFVLVCRSTGHIVGLGKESGEIHAAMQLALLCPHCRSPLGEEAHDVLYSLTAEGEEFLRTTRWIRGALEGALRARGCDPVILPEETPAQRVHGAAWYHGTALLIRVGNGAGAQDLEGFDETVAALREGNPAFAVRGLYVTASPAGSRPGHPDGACAVLDVAQLESGLDRLLEDVKRDHFLRLAGPVEVSRPDPRALWTPSAR